MLQFGRVGSRLGRGAALGAALVVAGCTDFLVAVPTEEPVPLADLVSCPPSSVPLGRHLVQSYAPGLQGAAAGLRYQASIAANTRTCATDQISGVTTVTATVTGRVLAGPAYVPGPVSLPVRIEMLRDGATVYSRVHTVTVTHGPGAQAADFTIVDAGPTFPLPDMPVAYEIIVGFQ